MCGFLGFINFNEINKDNLIELSNHLHHRGPDSDSYYINQDKKIYLCHKRLSIIDVSSNASQPMFSQSKRFIIMFNGEIYNFKYLKNKYLSNYKFQSSSDTEVILGLVELFGFNKTIEKLEGMFAIALFDIKENKFFLTRDRFGEKPLYYYNSDNSNKLFFTSDLLFLKKSNLFNNKINLNALGLYFQYNYIPSPYSIYQNIYKVKPGEIIEYNILNYKIKKNIYFDSKTLFNKNKTNLNFDESSSKLDNLLSNKINDQLTSDVPIGTFLSGGIDSTLITTIISKKFIKKIDTFTIGFDNNDFDETLKAKKIADYLGVNHHVEYLNNKNIIDTIDKIPHYFSEPFADSSQIPTLFLSEITRKKVKVALSGDGGDELFGGYNRYLFAISYLNKIKKIPYLLRSATSNSLYYLNKFYVLKFILNLSNTRNKYAYFNNKIEKTIKLINFKNNFDYYNILTTNNINKNLLKFKHIFNHNPALDTLNFDENLYEKLTNGDILTYLPDDILCKVDRSSMASSLEVRTPFLNHEIAKFATSLPHEYKINKNNTKIILKDIIKKYLPEHLINFPKHGFTFPLNILINTTLKEYFYDNLNSNSLSDFFDKKEILNLLNSHNNKYNDNSTLLWSILMFKKWIEYK